MDPRISDYLERFETKKRQFIEELADLPEDLHARSSRASDWSPCQVLDHVIISEKGTLGYMMKKTSSGWENIPLVNAEHVEQSEILNSSLISDRKWRAPQVMPEPEGKRTIAEMSVYWGLLRTKYVEFLEQLNPEFYERQIFRHPFSGPLNLWQTLEFLTHHITHHQHQICRIKDAAASEKN